MSRYHVAVASAILAGVAAESARAGDHHAGPVQPTNQTAAIAAVAQQAADRRRHRAGGARATAGDDMAQYSEYRLDAHAPRCAAAATPYLAAAARSGLSLVWKIVLIVELLGRPNGVGFEIGVAFQLFDVTKILTYALAFIAVMLVIETFLVQPLERHVSRWRPRTA
jgi:NitT/TauT family transport system permease protein